MGAIDDEPQIPSTTEDVAATPGWVEQSVEEIFAALPQQPVLTVLRNTYLDCLAGARGPRDIDSAHDRCRAGLIRSLREEQRIGETAVAELDQKLEALEAEITDRI